MKKRLRVCACGTFHRMWKSVCSQQWGSEANDCVNERRNFLPQTQCVCCERREEEERRMRNDMRWEKLCMEVDDEIYENLTRNGTFEFVIKFLDFLKI